MFRFAVLFTAAVLMAGPAAQAFDEVSLKKLQALNAVSYTHLTLPTKA